MIIKKSIIHLRNQKWHNYLLPFQFFLLFSTAQIRLTRYSKPLACRNLHGYMLMQMRGYFIMFRQQKRASVALVLIHNNDTHRYDYIKPALEQLRIRLSQSLMTTILEVSIQPEIKPHSTFMALLRDLIYKALDREWSRYRLLRVRLLPLDALNFLVSRFNKYVFSRRGHSVLAGWKRNSFVETVVTDKHIRGWIAFLESGADFIICFEDDAVFKDDSSQRVNELLDNLSRKSPDSLIYVDLAGGCEHSALNIDNLETDVDASFRFYKKPVTNTACSYLMSRKLVVIFIELITRRPWLRLIGVDWLMNKLFILTSNDGIECVCMHASPTIFKHGSITGEYTPWYPDRQNP